MSRHMLENKRALYLRRTEMAQEVFALVRAKIAAFTRTTAYGQRLTALLAEALEQLSGAEEVLVTLRGDDLSFREALAASAPQVRLTFREGDFRLGGLIAESPPIWACGWTPPLTAQPASCLATLPSSSACRSPTNKKGWYFQ